MLLLDGPLTSQPQEAVELDDTCPMARGLLGFWHAGLLLQPSHLGASTLRWDYDPARFSVEGSASGDAHMVQRSGTAPFAHLFNKPTPTSGTTVLFSGKRNTAGPVFVSEGGGSTGYGFYNIGGGFYRAFVRTSGSGAHTLVDVPAAPDADGMVGFTYDGAAVAGVVDGRIEAASAATGSLLYHNSSDPILLSIGSWGGGMSGSVESSALPLSLRWFGIWDRALTPFELEALHANPWQLFRVRQVWLPASAAPSADVAGSVALSLTATGSIAVAKPVSGSVAVALATSGSIAVAKPVAGGVGLALSATGAIAVNKPVAGSVAMGVACSGALTVPKPVAGSVAVGLTAAGSVAVAKPVAGAVDMALTTSGALTTVGMGGAVAVSVATAGSVAVAKPVSGAVLVSLTTAAALTIAKPVSGNVALSLVTSGSVQVAKPVAGAVSVALTAAGAVQVPKLLGGAVSVSLTAGGSVAVAKPVGGAVLLSLTTTGRIETATLRGLVTAVLTLRSTPTALTLRPTDTTLTTRAGSAALTLRPAADAALQFQTDDPV